MAIARIRAEGRAVAVELTAPCGAVPAVHRRDGVSAARRGLSRPPSPAALPARSRDAEAVDGSALVTVEAVAEPVSERRARWVKRGAIAVVLGFAVLAVAMDIVGGNPATWFLGVMVLLVGPIGTAVTAVGAGGMWLAYLAWFLPRYGITVEAVRVSDTSDLLGRSGNDTYTDTSGTSHRQYVKGSAATVPIAYHPAKPATAVVCHTWGRKLWDTVFGMGVLLFGLAVLATAVALAVGTVQGMYDDATTPQRRGRRAPAAPSTYRPTTPAGLAGRQALPGRTASRVVALAPALRCLPPALLLVGVGGDHRLRRVAGLALVDRACTPGPDRAGGRWRPGHRSPPSRARPVQSQKTVTVKGLST
ncbi:hypothetical protein ACFQ7B_23920 [Streptomyces erythrochromogenes]|uniref:hypothetical protein n=1 Tax=Streptomyces erythrochromogenes TaxID=285574 RepID=UPI0036A34269